MDETIQGIVSMLDSAVGTPLSCREFKAFIGFRALPR
jgi:hypothetical protein